MNISQLVKRLREIEKGTGNLDVYLHCGGGDNPPVPVTEADLERVPGKVVMGVVLMSKWGVAGVVRDDGDGGDWL